MLPKYRLTFEPMGLSKQVTPGTTIKEAADSMNIPIRFDCGGKGLCGNCRIIAEPKHSLSPLTEAELDILSPREVKRSYRLACQARIEGNLTVIIPDKAADIEEARGKTGIKGLYRLNPPVERIILSEDKPSKPKQWISTDIVNRITRQARSFANCEVYIDDIEALRQLSLPEVCTGEITLVNHFQKGVTAVIAGNSQRSLGLAVDIGTTTLAAYLCDFRSGEVLASAASVNPQRRYGEDVISRITMANEQVNGLKTLNGLMIDGINHLITRCLEQTGASHDDIDEVTLVGNTTMEQIFAGLHPHGLGVSPYLPVSRAPRNLKAVEVGLKLNPGTNLYLFPVISGFVGGDTVAAIVAEAPHLRDETTLIVDIGTNGELVLGNRKGLWATSCATGPALEGAHISCGMRAVSGAIHKVDIDPTSGEFVWSVLGDQENMLPMGICGSGLIDAMAAMRRAGILLPNGRLKKGMPGVVTDEEGVGREFVLVPAEESATGKNIRITLEDVRQFQLAKSALAVGIELLMRNAGLTKVDRTVLTGAFGAHFRWRNAVDVGMLPPEVVGGEVLSLENLAGVGAIMALLDKSQREEAAKVSQTTKFLELALDPDFAVRFPENTIFPSLDE